MVGCGERPWYEERPLEFMVLYGVWNVLCKTVDL